MEGGAFYVPFTWAWFLYVGMVKSAASKGIAKGKQRTKASDTQLKEKTVRGKPHGFYFY